MLLPVQASFPHAHVHVNPTQADSRSANHNPARTFTPAQLWSHCHHASAKLVCTDSLHSMYIWDPTASMSPLQRERFGGKHEILPREKAPALSWGFVTAHMWKEIIVDESCQWACWLIHFCGHFRDSLFWWLCNGLKLAPDESPESPAATPFWIFISLVQLLIKFGAYLNIWSTVPDQFFSVDDG